MKPDPVQLLLKRSEKEPFRQFMDLEVLEIKPGNALVAMRFSKKLQNIFGMLHGGAVFSLLDEAFQLACNAHGQVAVAQELTIYYLAPARAGARLLARVSEQHATRKTALYKAKVWEEDSEKMIARASAMAYRKGTDLPFNEKGELINES
ncbi:PaaI family thioesterase [Dethiosulfatarculus sandiegensis]|uniref:Phenylacetic acid degradation protein n=1 Tax=Dethiosulfatarculus sandiegensis TaxID=1429043 RepID=A0A0D2GEG5_9BACT|nr:PaaI family thioesterase [Dethiosulfatarculus sandiegensis]KIX13377.1 phenylacetic acid degradation protein [Dethiosulfatarculus sandiegensis]